jgi:hypothetical protein
MKIRILASGEIRHIDNSTGSALISAGLAELISKSDSPAPQPGDYKPPQPKWSVIVVTLETTITLAGRQQKFLAIRREVSRPLAGQRRNSQPGVVSYTLGGFTDSSWCSLPPDFVHDKKYANGEVFCSAFGCPVPPEILAEYKRQWKANPDLRAPYEGRPVPNRPDDPKADKAAIETRVENAAVAGVVEGQALLRRPGPRT